MDARSRSLLYYVVTWYHKLLLQRSIQTPLKGLTQKTFRLLFNMTFLHFKVINNANERFC